jgi:hypothetical protein
MRVTRGSCSIAPAKADALLSEKHRSAVFQFDRGGKEGPQRRGCDQAERRQRDVERALQHAAGQGGSTAASS